MIKISGLGDDITSLMIESEQQKIVEKILNAASNGQRSIDVKSKGATPVFLTKLEEEGISSLETDNGSYKLFWEF